MYALESHTISKGCLLIFQAMPGRGQLIPYMICSDLFLLKLAQAEKHECLTAAD